MVCFIYGFHLSRELDDLESGLFGFDLSVFRAIFESKNALRNGSIRGSARVLCDVP